MATIKLFVSHAAVDEPVVKAFADFLESGIGIHPESIFCTSVKGQGIKLGAEFKQSIRENLDEATTVVALISENYYSSSFSMCELGGAWLQAKGFIPVLIPPVRFADMMAVLNGLQAVRIDSAEDLDELRDELAERLDIKPLSTPRWNERRDKFLNRLPDKLKQLPKTPIVKRERLEKVENINAEYKVALEEAQEQIEILNNTISKLKKAKDHKSILLIERENMQAVDIFDEIVKEASESLSTLSSITQETMFSYQRGEDYYPGHQYAIYNWDDANRPLQYKEVELNAEENGIQLDESNPKVKKAIDSLLELNSWLTEKAPEEFFEWYLQAHEGYSPDLSDRNFWDKHLWP